MSQKNEKTPNLFEEEAKRKNISVEQVKKDYKNSITQIRGCCEIDLLNFINC